MPPGPVQPYFGVAGDRDGLALAALMAPAGKLILYARQPDPAVLRLLAGDLRAPTRSISGSVIARWPIF